MQSRVRPEKLGSSAVLLQSINTKARAQIGVEGRNGCDAGEEVQHVTCWRVVLES